MAAKRKPGRTRTPATRRAAPRKTTRTATRPRTSDINCEPVEPLIVENPATGGRLLAAYSCCRDSVSVLVAGLSTLKRTDRTAAAHLKNFVEVADGAQLRGELLEYSILLFGLKQEQREQLLRHIEQTYMKR
jgi:hypothetical protein